MERFRKIFSNTGGLNIAEPVRFPGRAACICKPPVIFYLKLEHSLSLLTVRRFEKKIYISLEPLFHAAFGAFISPAAIFD